MVVFQGEGIRKYLQLQEPLLGESISVAYLPGYCQSKRQTEGMPSDSDVAIVEWNP